MSIYGLLGQLVEAKVEFVLVGGLAVTLHGYRRVTLDVDVVLALNDENLSRFMHPVLPIPIDALRDAEFIERAHREKHMLAFALRGPDMMATVIDVLVRPVVPYEVLRKNAVSKVIGVHRLQVASIDDLIVMKTGTGRSKDMIDIEELIKIKASLGGRDDQAG
jgi:predicted nucleotidyltransferase